MLLISEMFYWCPPHLLLVQLGHVHTVYYHSEFLQQVGQVWLQLMATIPFSSLAQCQMVLPVADLLFEVRHDGSAALLVRCQCLDVPVNLGVRVL